MSFKTPFSVTALPLFGLCRSLPAMVISWLGCEPPRKKARNALLSNASDHETADISPQMTLSANACKHAGNQRGQHWRSSARGCFPDWHTECARPKQELVSRWPADLACMTRILEQVRNSGPWSQAP